MNTETEINMFEHIPHLNGSILFVSLNGAKTATQCCQQSHQNNVQDGWQHAE
jgi:hypothetical protein